MPISIINKIILFLRAVIVLLVMSTSPVYAYIDPGTGSFVIQMIIGFMIGGLFAVKLFWKKIVHAVKGALGKSKEEQDTETKEE